ncbi:MAG: hypothetical protein ACYSU7_01910 [Planctomycetota bacterium]
MLASTVALCAWAAPAPAGASFVVDFEYDDNGVALGNGQIIDTEYFSNFTIISPDTGVSHLGPAIFDSTPGGPNASGADPDLLVGLGNVLILQNTAYASNDGSFFDVPNDEADFSPLGHGTVVFDFLDPVALLTIDLVDINGGANLELTLTDTNGRTRTYHIPQRWTYDIAHTPLGDGYDTLDLTILSGQVGEGGGTATATEMAGFDANDVEQLKIRFFGSSPSAAIDNLAYVPGPPALLAFLVGLAGWHAQGGRRSRPIRAW